MSHTPHGLAEEFPAHLARMHHLKTQDAHFALLAERYHGVNGAIHRAETDIEPLDDAYVIQLRKERLALKDAIAQMLRAVPQAEGAFSTCA